MYISPEIFDYNPKLKTLLKHITKLNYPYDISIKWKNDYEANVIHTRGRQPEIVKIEFEL
ncbi:hypothetical protein CR203_06345 [Salipaludibacillus neizhouensis]|uniref:Uncharacterized protein n=1 Tax=Salipaludibacillus neizhouensis TaxID=885475 RepID=A0A3A9KC92_9BACI|nr:hypothetical protein CR203_06345 [Salipaludibacillus neizhouensis]